MVWEQLVKILWCKPSSHYNRTVFMIMPGWRLAMRTWTQRSWKTESQHVCRFSHLCLTCTTNMSLCFFMVAHFNLSAGRVSVHGMSPAHSTLALPVYIKIATASVLLLIITVTINVLLLCNLIACSCIRKSVVLFLFSFYSMYSCILELMSGP